MKKLFTTMFLLVVVTSCRATPTETAPALPAATDVVSVSPTVFLPDAAATTAPLADDFFTQNAIALPAPECDGLTQSQTDGPYYTAGSPQRNILYEDGMPGTRLLLVGYVLDENCQPLANAWLDFWQADATGEYDNAGYRLRGHQFTDAQGRYYLDTILPGLYQSRPIEHIHVKVKPDGGEEVTSQLYFPEQPVEGLTVTLEERDGYLVGYFNFIVQK